MKHDKYRIPIQHPEWLTQSTPGKTIDLFNQGRLPKSIDGWMLVVSLRHPLRAIYGSNLKAAWHLFLLALWDKWDNPGVQIWMWRAARLFRKTERDYWLAHGLDEEDLDRDDEEFEDTMRDVWKI